MKNQPYSIDLLIAGFTMNLVSDSEIELEEGYLSFIAHNKVKKADITIQCLEGLPTFQFEKEKLVFEAKNEEQKFYSIYRIGDELVFVIYNQQNKDEIQQIALLNEDFTSWKVHSDDSKGKIAALKYPLGPIIMHYMTLKSDAVMMHASCAYDGSKARIFTGFSGAGKSTMSKIWSDAGNGIVNDDRLIIRKSETGYTVYNTPMYYKDIPKSAPLYSIFLISHSPENKINKLNGAMAVSKVMAFSIQNNYDKQFIQNRLDFFSDLCSRVSVYELGFVPDESVIHFVLANET